MIGVRVSESWKLRTATKKKKERKTEDKIEIETINIVHTPEGGTFTF